MIHIGDTDELLALLHHLTLRYLRYLSDPKADTKLHTSMSGVELNEQLVCISTTDKVRMEYNMRQLFDNTYTAPSVQDIPQTVFVTAKEWEEFCKVSNKTVDTIKILVLLPWSTFKICSSLLSRLTTLEHGICRRKRYSVKSTNALGWMRHYFGGLVRELLL